MSVSHDEMYASEPEPAAQERSQFNPLPQEQRDVATHRGLRMHASCLLCPSNLTPAPIPQELSGLANMFTMEGILKVIGLFGITTYDITTASHCVRYFLFAFK